MDLNKLQDKFPLADIRWRISQAGVDKREGKPWAICLAYVTARAIRKRLNEVCGPANWSVEYDHLSGGVMATISIRTGNSKDAGYMGNWVSRQDGSPETKIDAFKGGISKAFVRTGAAWGIGDYLYDLDRYPSMFAQDVQTGKPPRGELGWHFQKANRDKGTPAFYWRDPVLPSEFLPEKKSEQQAAFV